MNYMPAFFLKEKFLIGFFLAFLLLDIFLFSVYFFPSQLKFQPFQKHPSEQIFCPVPKEFCRKWKIVNFNGKYLGVGVFLPKQTSFYAPFDGLLSYGKTKLSKEFGGHEFPNIKIQTTDGMEITFYFSGESKVIGRNRVVRGQELGIIKKNLPFDEDVSLVVSLTKNGKLIILSNKSFKQQ